MASTPKITGKKLVQELKAKKIPDPEGRLGHDGKPLIVTSGAGIGIRYLEICRKVLEANPKATAQQIIAELQKNHVSRGGIVHQATIDKAVQIAKDGEYRLPEEAAEVNIEDLPDPWEHVGDDAPEDKPDPVEMEADVEADSPEAEPATGGKKRGKSKASADA